MKPKSICQHMQGSGADARMRYATQCSYSSGCPGAHCTCKGFPLKMRLRLPRLLFLPAALLLGATGAVGRVSQSAVLVSVDSPRNLPRKPAMTAVRSPTNKLGFWHTPDATPEELSPCTDICRAVPKRPWLYMHDVGTTLHTRVRT